MPCEEVGEIEGRRLVLLHRIPGVVAREEAVAMRPRDPLDTVPVEHEVERARGATVGVGDEDVLVAAGDLRQLRVHRTGDPLRRRMQLGGKAADVDVRPAVEPDHGEHLARDRAAGQDQHVCAGGGFEGHLLVKQGRRLRHDGRAPGPGRSRRRLPHRGSRHRRRRLCRTPRSAERRRRARCSRRGGPSP